MKSFIKTSHSTIELTDEDGVTKEWTRKDLVSYDERFDLNHQMQIKGTWYVTLKSGVTVDEEE